LLPSWCSSLRLISVGLDAESTTVGGHAMPEPTSIRSLITPQDQTLRTVFNTQRSYFIDIYQREYKWKEENVRTLLSDIGDRFSQHQRTRTHPKEIQEHVLDKFEPYFLNTYLTSTTAANTSIVDGQQRLTTLLLILIKLYHILKAAEAIPENKGKTFSSKVVEQLIFETNDFGESERFKIFNENRQAALKALAEGGVLAKTDETRTRIAENFAVISQYYDEFLKGDQSRTFDLAKTTYYLTYLLDRISIVEIRIERQENVAMIFEVVNDRGLGLRPYEILKGKLIGGLVGDQKEQANTIWTDLQERYFRAELRNTTEKSLNLDLFFQTFFRAKFADTEGDYEKFEGDYHYEMYRNQKIRDYFGGFSDRNLLFARICGDIKYFAELYLELRTAYDYEAVIFNKLLDQNQQYLLIMSAIHSQDKERAVKIEGISAKFDQFHTILRLLDAYDSNSFQRLIYPLNKDVRDKALVDIKPLFVKALIDSLVEENILQPNQCADAAAIFDYERFKGIRNQWTNFSKYVLMRIDRYLAKLLDKPSYAQEPLKELEDRFNKNNLRRYGMHLEHILTHNDKNRAAFTVNDVFDEARFTQTRNLLGMVLLLKDKQNLSSSNEIYKDKRDTYAKSNIIWNELLAGHLPSVDLAKLPPELNVQPVAPVDRDGVFPLAAVDGRQRILFEAIKRIWAHV
jgi:uncharacterized protein with ParB-like and HNH nuclease domain